MAFLQTLLNEIDSISEVQHFGEVHSVKGLVVEAVGLSDLVGIGSHCIIQTRNNKILAEVVGTNKNTVVVMPFGDTYGITTGCSIQVKQSSRVIFPDESWLGRTINGFAEPIDNLGPLLKGVASKNICQSPIRASLRQRIGTKMDIGIKAVNAFITCCYGQRMGIFAGSGVGKSVMLAMMTKFASADVVIVGLIGERGREVNEFVMDYLGQEGLRKAIVVVATSDEAPLAKRQAAYVTMTLSEYFRDRGANVLCIIDSVTRFATAQREIGLAAGEPPTLRGYTPSVFSELSRLLERAGPGKTGNITGFFSVLVEGDDHNEPVSDAIRSIIDGHIVLSREIARNGIYPAIDILSSVSRMMPQCNTAHENHLIQQIKDLRTLYEEMSDMIKIGAYKKGNDLLIDRAIVKKTEIDNFINQPLGSPQVSLEECYKKLEDLLAS